MHLRLSESWSGLILIVGLVVWCTSCVSEQLKVTVANPANLAETGKVAGHKSMVYECETSQRDTKTRLKRHEGIMENLDRTDKLREEKERLASTMKKTIESTEQAWNNNVKLREILESGEAVCTVRLSERVE